MRDDGRELLGPGRLVHEQKSEQRMGPRILRRQRQKLPAGLDRGVVLATGELDAEQISDVVRVRWLEEYRLLRARLNLGSHPARPESLPLEPARFPVRQFRRRGVLGALGVVA